MGAYIFSSDDGRAHLSAKSQQTNNTEEILLSEDRLPQSYYPTLDPQKEATRLLQYQMNPTERNKSRFLAIKSANTRFIVADRLKKGARTYTNCMQEVPLYKATYPKPLYSKPLITSLDSVHTAVLSANTFLKDNYEPLSTYSVTDVYDSYLDMVDGTVCGLDIASFSLDKIRSYPKPYTYQEPLIRSGLPGPLQNTLQNILGAATKRNCNVTQMRELPTLDAAAMNVDAFKKFACSKNQELWQTFHDEPIRLSDKQIEEYVYHLLGPKANALLSKTEKGTPLSEVAMDRFTLDMKRDVKVTPGTKHVEERPKVQVIQAADPLATAYLCGIHRELVRRLKAVLNPNIHVLFDMSAEDFDGILAKGLQAGDKVLETDISSFDKSQDRAMALTAMMLLEDLGVEASLIEMIEASFGDITSVHLPTGTRFKFGSMMKSGLFLTLFVNTLLNITIACRVLQEELLRSRCAAFIGDDNIIQGVVSNKLMSQRCATWMNMEVKIMDSEIGPNSAYFCGGFIVLDKVTNQVCRVADPVKRLLKLGRPSENDALTDEDRRRALADEVKAWFRVGITEALEDAVRNRYGVQGLRTALLAMATFSRSVATYQATRGRCVKLYGGP